MLPFLLFSMAALQSSAAPQVPNLELWYDRPADAYGVPSPLRSWEIESRDRTDKGNPDPSWERYALPIGNGLMGAMLYGGVALDRIQWNVHSLWSGGPGAEGWQQDLNRQDAHEHLEEIRQALLHGDAARAENLSTEYLRGLGSEDRNVNDVRFGLYQTLGEIQIETGHLAPVLTPPLIPLPKPASAPAASLGVENYRRSLDLSTGVHRVSYQRDGVQFQRLAFCSNPQRVMVLHYSANANGAQNLFLHLESPHPLVGAPQDEALVFRGSLENNGLLIDVRIGVLAQKGSVAIEKDGIRVVAADAVTFILIADTDYAAISPTWRGPDPVQRNQQLLVAAMRLGFEKLLAEHVRDFVALHGRVALDLGATSAQVLALPTDERVKLQQQSAGQDPDLEELYFQYGRYLLMSSSRPGGLPANLQGLWCNEIVPPWNADYHLNINLQMNYWLAGPCNLMECQKPLIDYINALIIPGAATAKAYHAAAGWTAHLSSNIWGYTNPHPGKNRPRYWAYFPLAGSWLSTHSFEQFAFDGDVDYLREHAWQNLAGSADFLVDYLYLLPDGTLSSIPSWSPEHGPISTGTTADISIARELLGGAIEAARVIGESGERVDRWQITLDKLPPFRIGQHGQLQEWLEDIDDPNDQHRHLNHLFGLYPGHQISPQYTPQLATAAAVTLQQRGDGATGWSMGWKINFWARMGDGNHAYLMIRNLLKNGTSYNLLDLHPPFQIDGNFGGTAGVAEMLLQSQYRAVGGQLDLLPALPDAWPTGSFRGLRGRGGYRVDAEWANGRLTAATIHAERTGPLQVRCQGRVWDLEVEAGKNLKLVL